MDLEARLRAFAAFARRRSVSAAARELRISQPADGRADDPAVRVSLLGGPSAQTMDALRRAAATAPSRIS